MPTDEARTGPLSDLEAYVGLARLTPGLRLSPDGRRLVAPVSSLDEGGTQEATAFWELDPEGVRPARRLSRGAKGEATAGFTPAGDLLFVSARSGEPALWLLPAEGGEPWPLASPSGGVRGVSVSATGTVLFGSEMLPSATDEASDRALRAGRTEAGVTALLHEEFPIRFWNHEIGPARTRLFVGRPTGEGLELRDLTGHVGRALDEVCAWEISQDGATVVTTWAVPEPGGSQRYTLVAIDVATGERRTLADDVGHEYAMPRISPDGTRVAVVVSRRFTSEDPGDCWLGVVPLAGGELRGLAEDWDRRPESVCWTSNGSALLTVADHHGRAPLWRVEVATGAVTRLTADHGAYLETQVSPDGRWAYAARSAMDSPPLPVRIDLGGGAGVEELPSPLPPLELPGRLEEVVTTASDGTEIRGWLVLPGHPAEAGPAPLAVMIHGGPASSSKTWSWRWNPWLFAARGYAVLLPDFALSTGYGVEFMRRGWGQWGMTPYTDLLTLTDAAQARPDIDPRRAAALGGSFGGFMANWIATQTDRFSAIVSHASVWNLVEQSGSSDLAHFFHRELTPEQSAASSPHQFADAITTPMLITHGAKDYRCPIGEALTLWWALLSRSKAEDGSTPHKFLYLPDEDHFVLAPGHVKLWYETVFAFTDHHVLGRPWRRPGLLG